MPLVNRSVRGFGSRLTEALNVQSPMSIQNHIVSMSMPEPVMAPVKISAPVEAPRGYSSYEGFKSFANNGALSIDDIVKGLARNHSAPVIPVSERKIELARGVEPVYENVEPIFENVEPIEQSSISKGDYSTTHSLARALVAGDRLAVFTALRECAYGEVAGTDHLRGGVFD